MSFVATNEDLKTLVTTASMQGFIVWALYAVQQLGLTPPPPPWHPPPPHTGSPGTQETEKRNTQTRTL